jgi:hypothetical protein
MARGCGDKPSSLKLPVDYQASIDSQGKVTRPRRCSSSRDAKGGFTRARAGAEEGPIHRAFERIYYVRGQGLLEHFQSRLFHPLYLYLSIYLRIYIYIHTGSILLGSKLRSAVAKLPSYRWSFFQFTRVSRNATSFVPLIVPRY